MKKLISLLLVLALAAVMLAGCKENKTPGNASDGISTDAQTAADTEPAEEESALAILEKIWALYEENERFAASGGDVDHSVADAPGSFDMSNAGDLNYFLHIPDGQIANIDEAATLTHMINLNSFTSGVVHLKPGVSASDLAKAVRDEIKEMRWMCGFPDRLMIATVGETYVLIAFGTEDYMSVFSAKLSAAFRGAQILYDEPIG